MPSNYSSKVYSLCKWHGLPEVHGHTAACVDASSALCSPYSPLLCQTSCALTSFGMEGIIGMVWYDACSQNGIKGIPSVIPHGQCGFCCQLHKITPLCERTRSALCALS